MQTFKEHLEDRFGPQGARVKDRAEYDMENIDLDKPYTVLGAEARQRGLNLGRVIIEDFAAMCIPVSELGSSEEVRAFAHRHYLSQGFEEAEGHKENTFLNKDGKGYRIHATYEINSGGMSTLFFTLYEHPTPW